MANTYILIASNNLSSSAASVTFSSIPSTYTDLVLKMSTRNSTTGALSGQYRITFNSDTSSIYSLTGMYGNDGTAGSLANSSNAYYYAGWGALDSAGNTSNTFDSSEIYIPNYTSSSSKPMSSFIVAEQNATTDYWLWADAGLFRNTSAISSIKIEAGSSTYNFVSGSSFWLYGIKNT